MNKNLKNQNSALGNAIVHQESACPDYKLNVKTTYTSTSTATGKELEYVESLSRPLDEYFVLPKNSLDVINQLVDTLNLHKKPKTTFIKLVYIVNLVTKHANQFENNGFSLNAKRISKVLGIKHQEFRMLMDALCSNENGILKIRRGYKTGVSSMKYVLRENYCGDEVILLQFGNKYLVEKINNKGAQFYSNDPNTIFYLSFLNKLTISLPNESSAHLLMVGDFTRLDNTQTNLYKAIGIEFPLFCLHQIMVGNFRASRPDKLSRVHTNLTNLPKEFRYYLRCNGNPLWEIDIRNSQPLIATIVFENFLQENAMLDYPDDLKLYKQDCEQGKFYEYFMELNRIGQDSEARGEFKKRFFGDVFFSSVKEVETLIGRQFKERYPTCYNIICSIKGGVNSDDYNKFAIKLQQTEAQIIFDEVNIELLKMDIPAYNIFDSILYLPEHHQIVWDMIKKAFNKKGLNPTLNTNKYDSESEHTQGLKCA